jgi:hypothetical protein
MGTTLTPMLTLKDGSQAIRSTGEPSGDRGPPPVTAPGGQIVAELAIEGQRFFAVDENPPAFNLSPQTLKGDPGRVTWRIPTATTGSSGSRSRSFRAADLRTREMTVASSVTRS